MSFWATAIVAANSAVTTPTMAMTARTSGASVSTGLIRTIRYTPAVTIVAAWISADTGARCGSEQALPMGLLGDVFGVLEFVGCVLTYLATAAFAASLGQTRWLGRGAARAYVTASLVLLLLVVMGGVYVPEVSTHTAPWYTRPGVIARIPAIPWIMPFLLGVVLLRRAGDEQREGGGTNHSS